MFDFDDLEEQKATSTEGVSRRVEVAFQHGGEKWLREYQVGADATVLDLKKQIGEVAKIQFCRFGRPLDDDEQLRKEDQLDFSYLGRNLERVRPTKPEAPPTWNGDEEVTIIIDATLDLIHTRWVSKGSSVGELKTAMARDNASNAGPHDFELGIAGGSGRPLANEVVLSEIGIRQLDLLPG